MSDQGRKSVGDRKPPTIPTPAPAPISLESSADSKFEEVVEKATPDSQKSTLDKASESVSSTLDKGIASIQPGTASSPFPRSCLD
jgi:Heat shock protein 9/12